MTVSGWLFDSYSLGDRMVFWILTERGKAIRLEDRWTPSFYVAANEKADLAYLTQDENYRRLVKDFEFVCKYERLSDNDKSEVLKVTLADSRKANGLAKRIWMSGVFGSYRLYNVDLLPAQSYFYEHDLFPLAFCKVDSSNSGLKWSLEEEGDDSVWSTSYRLPDFTTIHVGINSRKDGKLAKFTDRIDSISIKNGGREVLDIKLLSESDIISQFVSEVTKIDPDFIFTAGGDLFGLPYLIRRAEQNHIDLYLSREHIKLTAPWHDGTSYFSYGRIYFKPAKMELLGRIHLDSRNSFVWSESGLHGYYEVARICRMPLHTAFRASIGTCLSSLQFYHATKRDILIPWKPTEAEHFKTLEELLIADRGGLILVPKVGVHERVAEFDFVSLFPNIMYKKNVSGETVRCDCCSDSERIVPELNCNVCTKRIGIVPASLEIVLKKREAYKRIKNSTECQSIKDICVERQNALKWINVTSFGYLGFNKSRFGKIDSHQAVCAYDRKILMRAARAAEALKFTIIHGIVDSLWVRKPNAANAEYMKLQGAIEEVTDFEISFEGQYKWIAFLPSKVNGWLPVQNRYFGVFSDGSLKIRGMEARRHDTPIFLSKFQEEILQIMARGNDIEEVKKLMPEITAIFQNYLLRLKKRDVPVEELVFTKQLSKGTNEYLKRNTVENGAIQQLADDGLFLRAGQIIQYVIIDYYRKNSRRRSIPAELADDKTSCDVNRYGELLAEVGNSVIQPFGNVLRYKAS